MSETPSKKHSTFDLTLLGIAVVLALGLFIFGPSSGHSAESPEKEAKVEEPLADQDDTKVEKKAEPVKVEEPKVVLTAEQQKIAEMEAELAKARKSNADLESQLRSRDMALEMKGVDVSAPGGDAEALNAAKAALEAEKSQVEQLKSQLAALEKASAAMPEKSGDAEKSAKLAAEIDAERKRNEELIRSVQEALKKAQSGK